MAGLGRACGSGLVTTDGGGASAVGAAAGAAPIGFRQFSFLLAAAFQGKASELQAMANGDFYGNQYIQTTV